MNINTNICAASGTPVVSGASGVCLTDKFLGEKIPLEAIIEPDRFYVVVKQVAIKQKIGSILMPTSAVDAQSWTHGMALVIKVGPSVYRGRKFEDVGLTPDDGPKVGDVIYFEARTPRRLKVDGEEYLLIPDDAIMGRFSREHLARTSFTVGMMTGGGG